MARPITPRFFANTILLQNLQVNFNPVWNGAAWVLTPTEILLSGLGSLNENGVYVANADIVIPASDLPPAGQSALTDLYNYIEGEMQTKYEP
jgi:hypothetical protein